MDDGKLEDELFVFGNPTEFDNFDRWRCTHYQGHKNEVEYIYDLQQHVRSHGNVTSQMIGNMTFLPKGKYLFHASITDNAFTRRFVSTSLCHMMAFDASTDVRTAMEQNNNSVVYLYHIEIVSDVNAIGVSVPNFQEEGEILIDTNGQEPREIDRIFQDI